MSEDGTSIGSAKPRRFGRYQLLASLGTGGMGEVFLARHKGVLGFEKLVVVKCIHPHLAKKKYFVNMFLDEARLAARINDPHVVQLYELGQEGDTLYMVMEHLSGETLRTVIRAGTSSERPPSPHLAARIIADVAGGLHTAHELRDDAGRSLEVVHRDVSPSNIVVLYSGGVKVVDFGVAKARGRLAETVGEVVKGKYGYMSPEHIKNQPIDRRSDIFSLGVVLWESLTLRRLFRGDNELATMRFILEGRPPPPSSMRPSVPVELDVITAKALRKGREQRYQTAQDMRTALEQFLHTSTIPAGPLEVADYMKGLVPQRIEARNRLLETVVHQGDDAPIMDLTELAGSLEGSDSVSSQVTSSEREAMAKLHAALLRGTVSVVLPATAPLKKKLRWPTILGAAVVLAGAVVTGAVLALLDDSTGAPIAKRVEDDEVGAGKTGDDGDETADGPPGGLRVAFSPSDAILRVDGEVVAAISPADLSEIAPGEHVVAASAAGFEPGERTVTVLSGKVTEIVLALEALPQVTFVVGSDPKGASVELDGVLAGETPLTVYPVRPEVVHTFRFSLKGYVATTEEASGPPGKTVAIDVVLEKGAAKIAKRPTGRLFVQAKPTWAIIYLGGRRLGETPLLGVRVPAGTLRLTAVDPKTKAKKKFTVKVPAGGKATATVKF